MIILMTLAGEGGGTKLSIILHITELPFGPFWPESYMMLFLRLVTSY